MAAQAKITLFDLASKDGNKCWSLNPWKARFVLNFKGLDYQTEFVEYPDLKPRLAPHFDKPLDQYTSPTIQYTDGRYIMDSKAIAQTIDKDHPQPSLHLDSSYLTKLEEILPRLMPALSGHYIPTVPKRLLNEASVPYWYKTREAKFGMTLDELEKSQGGETGWSKAEPMLKQVTEALKENPLGPFFAGKTVSYADFVWAGFLIFWRRIGDDKFSEVLKRTGDPAVHEALLKAVEPWSERDDH
jgi:glutathione S-transferase